MKIQSYAVKKLVSIVFLSLWVFSSGCATVKPAKPMTAEQREKVKASLGHIGIVHASYLPSTEFQVPAKGAASGVGKGMLAGAAAPFKILDGCSGDGCAYLGLFAIAMVPVTTVIGGVGGGVVAESAEEVTLNEEALKDALSKLEMQKTFAARVLEKTNKIEDLEGTLIEGRGPAAEGDIQSYESLAMVNTVKEITLKSFKLKGQGSINPPMSLLLTASARLVRTSDNSEFYSKTFTCSRGNALFAEWAANAGSMLQAETENCYNDLARQIVEDIYVLDTLADKAGS